MTSLNQHHDPVATVRLRPFNEHHWHHRLTYRPMYTEWTDALIVDKQRSRTSSPRRYSSKQLTVTDPIDLETLKLDDEILLNELQDVKQSATVSSLRDKYRSRHGPTTTSPTNDHRASLAETFYPRDGVFTPLRNHRQSSSLRSQPTPEHFELSKQVDSIDPIQQVPDFPLGPKSQTALDIQLRQSAITRDQVLSARNTRHPDSIRSPSPSKRSHTSAHPRHPQRPIRTSSSSNGKSSLSDLASDCIDTSLRISRAKSSSITRPVLDMLKRKNERMRQQQKLELKTILVEPWRQLPFCHHTSADSIPNSIDIMHRLCGQSTTFERNLREDYYRQLNRSIGFYKCNK